jgi:hypothetical protein
MSPVVYTGDVELTYSQRLWGVESANYGKILFDRELKAALRVSAAELIVRRGAVHESNAAMFLDELIQLDQAVTDEYSAIDLLIKDRSKEKVKQLHLHTDFHTIIAQLFVQVSVLVVKGRA